MIPPSDPLGPLRLLRIMEARATLIGLNRPAPEGPDLSPLLRIEQMIADSIEALQEPPPVAP